MASYKNYKQPEKEYDEKLDRSKKETSLRSFEETIEHWSKYCSYFRAYPDKFIDFIKDEGSKFELFPYQRLFLRVFFRFQECYMTFTRGTSKSFLQILALYLKCIMYPGIQVFLCSPGKAQATVIARDKIEEIWKLFPILQGEIKYHAFNPDNTRIVFHNGSSLDVVVVGGAARGRRKHGGSIEEICDMDRKKDDLNEAVLPMMQIDRRATNGEVDPNEIKKFTFFVTTSGTRQSFAYEKAVAVYGNMMKGRNSIYIGAGWQLGTMHGLLSEEEIMRKKEDPTLSALGFAREYESVWTGSNDKSFVKQEDLDACRNLKEPEFRATYRKHKGKQEEAEYVISYDVARAEGMRNDESAISVIKIIPRGNGDYRKQLVFLHSFEGRHFDEQARYVKDMVDKYNARVLVIDANGVGKGLVDWLTQEIDEHPPYSVINDDRYDKYKKPNSIPMIFSVKAQSRDTNNADIYNVFANYIAKRDIQLLEPEIQAKQRYLDKKMDSEKVAEMIRPHVLTNHLVDEILNQEYRMAGDKVNVKPISSTINRDKFISLAYGLFYVHLLEKENKNKKEKRKVDLSRFASIRRGIAY